MIDIVVRDGDEEAYFSVEHLDQVKAKLQARFSEQALSYGLIVNGKALLPTVDEAIAYLKTASRSTWASTLRLDYETYHLELPSVVINVRGGTVIRHRSMTTVRIPWHNMPAKDDLAALRYICIRANQDKMPLPTPTNFSTCGIDLEQLMLEIHRLREEKKWDVLLVVDYFGRRPAYRTTSGWNNAWQLSSNIAVWVLIVAVAGGAFGAGRALYENFVQEPDFLPPRRANYFGGTPTRFGDDPF